MSHEETPEIEVGGIQRLAALYYRIGQTGEAIDARFRGWERRHAHQALRYSLAFVFFWFGITKPLAISPADAVVRPTLAATPLLNELIGFQSFFSILGWWEALVGLGLLWKRTVRIAVAFMCIQMLATFLPLFVVPAETFRWWPLVPSAVGLYIIKNFALATAGLVVAAIDSEPLFERLPTGRFRAPGSPASRLRERLGGVALGVRTLLGTTVGHLSVRSLQLGLGLVFVWSGILMVSASPTPGKWIASLVPAALVADSVFIPLFGALELAIGLYLLIPGDRSTHAAAYLSIGYMGIAMLPVVLAPSQVFVTMPFEPTFEGVYIFKDLILVAGILTVDVHLNDGSAAAEPSGTDPEGGMSSANA